MSDNKFIQRLKGQQTPKSVVEVQNDKLVAPFTGVPYSTDVVGGIIDDKDSSIVVAKGAQNWKLDGSSLVVASSLSGDGADYTGEFNASGSGLWINAAYSLPATIFTAGTKWVLKLCGKNLLTTSGETIGFTLVVKVGNTHITSKAFTVAEGANVFCRQLSIDFSESEQAVIKAQSGDNLTVQLLCSDANASATIYNGMTVFTALQRRVDGDSVASDKKTFDELVEDVEDLEEYVDVTFVKKAGDTMTGALNIADIASSNTPLLTLTHSNTATYKWNIAPRYNSTTLSVYPGSTETNGFRFATTGFVPSSNNARYLGSASLKWKGVYTGALNNGADLVVPNKAGTLATMGDVELAANSGSQLYSTGVWYAKMYAASTVPTGAQYDGTNYADFSQVDADNNPVIKIYTGASGAWTLTDTITPPAEYNGYIWVTSKIWDIVEQTGQQGGEVLWDHTHKTFTPYPRIIDVDLTNYVTTNTVQTITALKTIEQLDSAAITGTALVLKGDNQHLGTDPATNVFNSINFTDVNDATVAKFSSIQTSDGWSGFLAGCGSDPTHPHNNMLMIANGTSKLLLIPPTTSHNSCAVRKDYLDTTLANYLQNTATGTNSLTILGDATSANTALNIGPYSTAEGTYSLAIGPGSGDAHRVRATKTLGIAIGYDALCLALDSIQLGTGQLTTNYKFSVWNHTMLDKTTGKIPIARLGDDTSVAQGNVLTLDSNGAAVWQAPSGGGSAGQSIDAEIVGTLTITDNSIVSGFSNSNYLKLPGVFELGSSDTNSFEIGASFTTTSVADSDMKTIITGHKPDTINAAGIEIRYADFADQKIRVVIINGASQTLTGTTNLSPNTKYYIKFEYDGTDYKLWLSTDGASYSLEVSAAMSKLATPAELLVGKMSLASPQSVDMADLYIKKNGQIIWQGMDAPGLHQRVAKGHEVIAFQAPTAGNNYTWYRKYADGWVEQGGITTNDEYTPVILPIPMQDTNYILLGQCEGLVVGNYVFVVMAKTTTSFTADASYGGGIKRASWQVSGMAA